MTLEQRVKKLEKEMDYLTKIHDYEFKLQLQQAIKNHLVIPFKVVSLENKQLIEKTKLIFNLEEK